MFACEQEGVAPDFLCTAKGITGGYMPLAATMTTDRIFGGFLGRSEESRTFFHGHTYTGNPLACAVAVANIDLFEKEQIVKRMESGIETLKDGLRKFSALAHVGEARQRGFMVGIELVKNKDTKKPFAPKEKVGQKVIMEARRRGVAIRPLGDVIVLMPPIAMGAVMLRELLDVTFESIKEVTG
jgi:adenosylmethionine-8-amino-7-oxononanoate aminotransferase